MIFPREERDSSPSSGGRKDAGPKSLKKHSASSAMSHCSAAEDDESRRSIVVSMGSGEELRAPAPIRRSLYRRGIQHPPQKHQKGPVTSSTETSEQNRQEIGGGGGGPSFVPP